MGIHSKSIVGRNEPCPCKSGLKFKHCHGDALKQEVCNRVANEKMVWLIREEQKKRGLVLKNYKCNNCGHDFDEPTEALTVQLPICPKCQSTDIERRSDEKES